MHLQSFFDVFAADAVVSEKGPQAVQFPLPHPTSYLPTPHAVQDVWPLLELNVPGPQISHCIAFVLLTVKDAAS
jgi:hypothetical protein